MTPRDFTLGEINEVTPEELNAALHEIRQSDWLRDWLAQHGQQPSRLFPDWCRLILEVVQRQRLEQVLPDVVVQEGS